MHTLGFYHEQSRADRDAFIRVVERNIAALPDVRRNFQAYGDKDIDHLGEEYDYASVMHYPANAFARAHNLATIEARVPLAPGVEMGQRRGFSPSDVVKLRKLYRCNVECNAFTEWKCADGMQCVCVFSTDFLLLFTGYYILETKV